MTLLVAWLWQGVLVTAIAGVVLGLLRERVNAATRYLLWWTTLFAVVLLPIAHLATTAEALVATTAPASANAVPLVLPLAPAWLPWSMLAIWCGTSGLRLTRLLRSVAHVRRLKRAAVPLTSQRSLPLSRVAMTRGRRAAIATCDVAVPCAIGLGRALVLLPPVWIEALRDDDLDLVVLHEYGHLARRDDWGQFLQALVQAFVGWHPAVGFIGRRLDLERESACDDFVVRHRIDARTYAAFLARAAAMSAGSATRLGLAPALGTGIVGRTSVLRRRILRLVFGRQAGRTRLLASAIAVGTAGILGLLTLLVHSGPLVAFRETEVVSKAEDTDVGVASSIPGSGSAAERPSPPDEGPGPRTAGLPERADVVSARRIVESPVVPLTNPAIAWSNAVPAGPGSQQPQSSLLSVPQRVDDLPVRPLPHAWSAGPAPAPAWRGSLGDPALRPGQDGRSGPDFGAVGKGAKHASLSIAGFFTRAGRSIADSF